MNICWHPPCERWKLTIDGSVHSKGQAGRQQSSDCRAMGFRSGLMAWGRGIRQLIVESDSTVAVAMVANATNVGITYWGLVQDIRSMRKRN
ncbi:hypothetical protein Ancab_011628 [Ancistrocladus abbreviatus]